MGRLRKELPLIGVGMDSKKKAADQGIRYPQISMASSAGFGDTITDEDRLWAAQREPVAHRITYMMAMDIFDNWFEIGDPKTEGPDPNLNQKVQAVLNELNAKSVFTDAGIYERILGWSLIVLGCDDAKTVEGLKQERREGSKILQLEVYRKGDAIVAQIDEDQNSERFGEPLIYRINRGRGSQFEIHYSRTIEPATRLGKFSVLDPIWDDLTCFRNIRWGMGQTMFRYGGGFPVITISGATKKQLEDWADDPSIKNFTARTFFLKSDIVGFEFAGLQGRALNPEPYYKAILENLSAGSGIPEAVLKGAQAGAIAGSEVNEREYFKVISSLQSKFEPFVRKLINLLMESGQIDFEGDYTIDWKPGFEPSETTRNQADLIGEQANNIRLNYMTIDEIRERMGLDLLPNGEGSVVPGQVKVQPFGASSFRGEAMDKIEGIEHPAFIKLMKGIVERARGKQITREQAIVEANLLIDEYGNVEDQRALSYLRLSTGQREITLSPEVKRKMERWRQRYKDDFIAILDDALKAGEEDAAHSAD